MVRLIFLRYSNAGASTNCYGTPRTQSTQYNPDCSPLVATRGGHPFGLASCTYLLSTHFYVENQIQNENPPVRAPPRSRSPSYCRSPAKVPSLSGPPVTVPAPQQIRSPVTDCCSHDAGHSYCRNSTLQKAGVALSLLRTTPFLLEGKTRVSRIGLSRVPPPAYSKDNRRRSLKELLCQTNGPTLSALPLNPSILQSLIVRVLFAH